jgi:tetratricopeptide (TPR) repeat protein
MADNWSTRVSAVWAMAETMTDEEVLLAIDALVAERPGDHAVAVFEAASARDYVGREADAEPLYRRAIALGPDAATRPRAVIQFACTLRNLAELAASVAERDEQLSEAVTLLEDLLAQHPDDEWTAPSAAFLALTLASRGQEREAASVALVALAGLLPAYNSSVRDYAKALVASR